MESILDTTRRVPRPRQAVSPRHPASGGLRTSIILVVVGLVAIALGGMLYAAAVDTAAGVGPGPAAGIGSLLAVLGAVLFIIGLLTEFFAMGSFLESIALSSQETASLLRSHQPAVPGSSSPSKDSLVSLRL